MTKRGGRKQKHSFYFPDWMSREVEAEAARLDRSTSWILQRAWRVARAEMARMERSRAPRTPNAGAATRGLSPVG
ncbi:MAG TPA: TIGR04563 family protein [Polyangia bacterium]|nr:TIGR04563 family protein [Polyangia bacterium]